MGKTILVIFNPRNQILRMDKEKKLDLFEKIKQIQDKFDKILVTGCSDNDNLSKPITGLDKNKLVFDNMYNQKLLSYLKCPSASVMFTGFYFNNIYKFVGIRINAEVMCCLDLLYNEAFTEQLKESIIYDMGFSCTTQKYINKNLSINDGNFRYLY